jgi:rhamnose transport system permease protein
MAIFPKAVPVRKSWDTAIIVLLFVVLVLASVTTDNFLTALNFSYIFSNTSEIMIIAFAMLFMIILGEIDLSVASILALSSCMLGWSYAQGAPIWLAMIICLAVGTLCGFINGFLVKVRGWLIGGNYWHLSVIPWCC